MLRRHPASQASLPRRNDPLNRNISVELKKAVLFDPSQGTSNIGDQIIRRAIDRELNDLLAGHFVVRYGTHSPLATLGSYLRGSRNQIISNCKSASLKLICGTNILKENLFHLNNDWVVGPISSKLYEGSILVGAGLSGNGETHVNAYTRRIYDRVLSHEHIHSVRDEKAADFLRRLGFEAINTGCPTTWEFARNKQQNMDWTKSRDSVVFTLTDYAQDPIHDAKLIDLLLENYKHVYFWPQGVGDSDYLSTLTHSSSAVVHLAPTLDAYMNFLTGTDCDYIGTRLHGGVLAQEFEKRTIILAVDNRARDMSKTAPIVSFERTQSAEIVDAMSSWPTPTNDIGESPIHRWKRQLLG